MPSPGESETGQSLGCPYQPGLFSKFQASGGATGFQRFGRLWLHWFLFPVSSVLGVPGQELCQQCLERTVGLRTEAQIWDLEAEAAVS